MLEIKTDLNSIIAKSQNLILLYVEDDSAIAKSTISLLNRFFNTIIYAKDGEDGFNKFNENHIDLIITDINMPNMNGLDMLKKILKLSSHPVPAIITTAHSEINYYQKAISLNVKGYLPKPLVLSDLINLIDEVSEEIYKINRQNNKLKFLQKSNEKLLEIGYALSSEKNYEKILETILLGAKDIANADGGTLYLYNKFDLQLVHKDLV